MRLSSLPSRTVRLAPKLVLPTLLLPVALFGGATAEGFEYHAWIIAGAGLVSAICLAFWDWSRMQKGLIWLLAFALSFVLLGTMQLLPLPSAFILALPGREVIADGWALFDVQPATFSISMAPDKTLRALGYVLIPIASTLLCFRLGWRRSTAFLAWAIVGTGCIASLYGLAQVITAEGQDLYLYELVNYGNPTGFFSNVNHQASFLLMGLPFTAALIGDARSEGVRTDSERARLILLLTLVGIQLTGVVAAGSAAAFLLSIPTLILSIALIGSRQRRLPAWLIISITLLFAVIVALVATSPVLKGVGLNLSESGDMTRLDMARVVIEGLKDHIWTGSGLGTFEPVFKLYEDPDKVTNIFANQAHNEYLQWALETGLPGVVLLAVFVVWWFSCVIGAWRKSAGDAARLRRAASIATLIVFLHSLVDYPVRTPAILFLASVCLSLLVLQQRRARPVKQAEPADEQKSVIL